MKNSIIDILSTALTAVQTNEVMAVICCILTCISILLGIFIKIWNWYRQAKSDGVIKPEELEELKDIIDDTKNKLK